MELEHRFTVPAGVEETWAHFNDIAGVAECFPGAQVTEADEDSFSGTVKVKLGPIALVYNGTGTFVEKDESARRMVIDAKGKDKRGNGTAGAKVTAVMTETAPGTTEVAVTTDLAITGKAAQFGRGNVMKDVSDKLLGQFVACLEQRMDTDAPASEEAVAATATPPVPEEETAPTSPPGGATPPPPPPPPPPPAPPAPAGGRGARPGLDGAPGARPRVLEAGRRGARRARPGDLVVHRPRLTCAQSGRVRAPRPGGGRRGRRWWPTGRPAVRPPARRTTG